MRQFSDLKPEEKVAAVLAAQGTLTEVSGRKPDLAYGAITREEALYYAGVNYESLDKTSQTGVDAVFARCEFKGEPRFDRKDAGPLFVDPEGGEALKKMNLDSERVHFAIGEAIIAAHPEVTEIWKDIQAKK